MPKNMLQACGPGLAGLGLSAVFACRDGWTLQEFCWSTWLAAFVFSCACAAAGPLRIMLRCSREAGLLRQRLAWLAGMPDDALAAGIMVAALALGAAMLYAYSYIFAFYGLFLSVFAEMEPRALFGRNGFINSDFYTPAVYLLERFWPMAAGTLICSGALMREPGPWKIAFLPFRAKQIVRIHLLVVLMPFFALAAWALVGERYHLPVIVALLGLFFLLPDRLRQQNAAAVAQKKLR